MLVTAIVLLWRSTGLYPTVFGDEYSYSLLSRLVPLGGPALPNYLYFWIYRATNACGDGFLGCVHLLNIAFFVSAAPFIYLLGRRITGKKTALLIAVLSIVGPLNVFTAYFMPESLYFLSFWAFTYFALRIRREQHLGHWILLGAGLGLVALVKPHALFLLPALAIYLLAIQFQGSEGERGSRLGYPAFFASAITTKFAFGFVIAGTFGLTLFGGYTSYASGAVDAPNRYGDLARLAFENFQGHALALVLLFSVPVAHLLLMPRKYLVRTSTPDISTNTALYASLVLGVLVIVVALFTASIAGLGSSNARLHMRYYDFALPLLFLVAASQISLNSTIGSIWSRAIVALPIGVAILYAAYTRMAPYTPILFDGPEIRGLTYNLKAFYALSGLSFVALLLWVYAARIGAKVFVYVFMPLAILASGFYSNIDLRQRLVPDVFDKAGIETKQYLSSNDLAKLVVVGSDAAGLYHVLFHLDSPQASLVAIPDGATLDLSKLPPDKDWALVIGDHPVPEAVFYQQPMNGFTLVRIRGTNVIDFKKSVWPGVLVNARGLWPAEPWGAWSSGNAVTFEFFQPLPEKFTVHLAASAFGPNVGKEFVARVGDSVTRFTLSAAPEERTLEFSNPKRLKTLTIDIPSPVSPLELGLRADGRKLGVAFVELRIEPL